LTEESTQERACARCQQPFSAPANYRCCSTRCYRAWKRAEYRAAHRDEINAAARASRARQKRAVPVPAPLLAGCTIILSLTGRLRFTTGRTLWRLDQGESDIASGLDPRTEAREASLIFERMWWNARYNAALNDAADKPVRGSPILPRLPQAEKTPTCRNVPVATTAPSTASANTL
jgi:hypothetical protein